MTKSGKLNLVKHFAAFLKIQGDEEFKNKIKDFFIVINAGFDRESLASKGITAEKIETQDEFLNVGNSAKYKLRDLRNSIVQYLKQGMSAEGREASDKEIKGFLNELVFVVNSPNDAELEELIKNEISSNLAERFKYFGDDNSVFNALFVKMSNWMKDREGHSLSPKEGREFFEKVEQWASTLSEIKESQDEIKCVVKRTEEKVDEIGKNIGTSTNNQQVRKEPIWFNMRYPVRTFTGRRSELQKIYKELHKTIDEQAEVSQIVVIGGLGGIGKSELARKYAYEYRKDYDGNIIWINAETQGSLEESFKGLAEELNKRLLESPKISITEKESKFIVEDVYRYFEDVKGLFIFDNAEGYRNISKFLPSSLNHRPYVLITSRDTKWEAGQKGKIDVIELDVLDELEALEFFTKSLNIDNTLQYRKVEKLSEELQYLPLALKQAVVYIHNKNEESRLRGDKRFEISNYLKEYQQNAGELLKKGVYENEDRYTKTVLTTWNITMTYISEEHGFEALNILEIMAYLDPDDVRVKEIFSKSIADDKEKLWNAVKLLNRYSMIKLREGIVNIHRLVQEVTRLKLQEQGREEEVLRKALELINDKAVREDISHIVSVWEYASKYGKLIGEFYFSSVYIHKAMFSLKNKGRNALHLLVESGSCKAIMSILMHVEKHHLDKFGEVINIKDDYGQTPLHVAAARGKLNVVRYLVGKGANIHAEIGGYTPLHFAAHLGWLKIVRYLIGKGANVNAKNICGGTALHGAAYRGELNVVKYLVNEGADVNASSTEPNLNGTPLHCSVHSGRSSIVRYLLDRGADICAEDEEGKTPLYRAAGGRSLDIVKCLVEAGSDICTKIKSGDMIPLYAAAKCGSVSIMKYFIGGGINVNIKDKYGNTPLHIAAGNGNFSVVRYLVRKGASVVASNEYGETPLHFATCRTVHSGDTEMVEYLVYKGADVHARDKDGRTPLHCPARYGSSCVAEYLIQEGVYVDTRDKDGNTPLHIAAEKGNIDVAKVLLKHNADINAKDEDCNTPLHLAAMMGNVGVARVLLKYNADVNTKNNEGRTALYYAVKYNHQKLVELLLTHGAVPVPVESV
ncbi:MAG: ankyrin repeat domain-containing protein [Rickettsiales bacterium]|nr:ankyrin repeat domain-containing protein [Rickettsiales bacterium]